MRRVKPIQINVHPSLYEKMEQFRREYDKKGIRLTQIDITNIISKKWKVPKLNRMDLIGGRL